MHNNYYHFVIDLLPKLFMYNVLNLDCDIYADTIDFFTKAEHIPSFQIECLINIPIKMGIQLHNNYNVYIKKKFYRKMYCK